LARENFMRIATLLLALFLVGPLAAQAGGDTEAERAGYERELAQPWNAVVIRSAADAAALPADVAAVVSISKLDDATLQELKKRAGLKSVLLTVWKGTDAWLTDDSMDILAGFPALERLKISLQAKVSGAGIGKLARAKTLKALEATDINTVTPAQLAPFKKHGLQELALPITIGPALFEVLATLPDLRRLSTYGAAESGDAPFKGIEKCKKLEHLRIAGPNLKPAMLDGLTKSKLLKSLDLAERALMEWNDDALGSIGKIKTLEALALHGNAMMSFVSSKGFEKLHVLKSLKRLDIAWDFGGVLNKTVLAAWLANLPELEVLNVLYLKAIDLDVVTSLPNLSKLTDLTFMTDDVTNDAFAKVIPAATGLKTLAFVTASLTDDVAIDTLLAAPAALKKVEITEKGDNLVNVPYRVREQREDLEVRVHKS